MKATSVSWKTGSGNKRLWNYTFSSWETSQWYPTLRSRSFVTLLGGGPALLASPESVGNGGEGGSLYGVVERFELNALVYAAQGIEDELVGEPGVLR